MCSLSGFVLWSLARSVLRCTYCSLKTSLKDLSFLRNVQSEIQHWNFPQNLTRERNSSKMCTCPKAPCYLATKCALSSEVISGVLRGMHHSVFVDAVVLLAFVKWHSILFKRICLPFLTTQCSLDFYRKMCIPQGLWLISVSMFCLTSAPWLPQWKVLIYSWR